MSWQSVVHNTNNLLKMTYNEVPTNGTITFLKVQHDTVCEELKFADDSMISIDCIAAENEVAKNMYQQSELDYLIYNDLVGYADLILNGDPGKYLKNVTDYSLLD